MNRSRSNPDHRPIFAVCSATCAKASSCSVTSQCPERTETLQTRPLDAPAPEVAVADGAPSAFASASVCSATLARACQTQQSSRVRTYAHGNPGCCQDAAAENVVHAAHQPHLVVQTPSKSEHNRPGPNKSERVRTFRSTKRRQNHAKTMPTLIKTAHPQRAISSNSLDFRANLSGTEKILESPPTLETQP